MNGGKRDGEGGREEGRRKGGGPEVLQRSIRFADNSAEVRGGPLHAMSCRAATGHVRAACMSKKLHISAVKIETSISRDGRSKRERISSGRRG